MDIWDFNPNLFFAPEEPAEEAYNVAAKRESAVKLQALKYLMAREKTTGALWKSGGSRLGRLWPRIIEVGRARSLARELGYEFTDQAQIDLFLPGIAKDTVGEDYVEADDARADSPYED